MDSTKRIFSITGDPKIGAGLYKFSIIGFAVETVCSVFFWWVFKACKVLLTVIIGFNLPALSFYSPQVEATGTLLGSYSTFLIVAVLIHSVLSLIAVGVLSTKDIER